MSAPKKKPLMRLLGEFVGHVAHGVKADPAAAVREGDGTAHEVRRETTEEVKETPAGQVVLRRTTIEEVVLPPPTESGR
jgi:hypothetical protein